MPRETFFHKRAVGAHAKLRAEEHVEGTRLRAARLIADLLVPHLDLVIVALGETRLGGSGKHPAHLRSTEHDVAMLIGLLWTLRLGELVGKPLGHADDTVSTAVTRTRSP